MAMVLAQTGVGLAPRFLATSNGVGGAVAIIGGIANIVISIIGIVNAVENKDRYLGAIANGRFQMIGFWMSWIQNRKLKFELNCFFVTHRNFGISLFSFIISNISLEIKASALSLAFPISKSRRTFFQSVTQFRA